MVDEEGKRRIQSGRSPNGLCRDCGACSMGVPCPACGGHRTLSHPELHTLSIAHIDCDAFFASVEKRDNPALANVPVVVGGGKRGVVAAACYHARLFGIHSAMPMFKALELCPDLTVVRGRMDVYAREGLAIREMMRELTPLVEPLSIDEAFLDLSGTQALHRASPAESLVALQARIRTEIGVSVSVGLSFNKFLAKTASDLDKPNGFAVIGKAEALDFLADKPVDFVFGIGPKFAGQLRKAGVHTIADARRWGDRKLAARFGDNGLRLARLSRAEDHRPVRPTRERKSVSAETTFSEDIADLDALKDKLFYAATRASTRAKAKGVAGRVVTLKLKTARFQTLTRRRTLAEPVQLADQIFRACLPMLEKEVGGTKYRLIGAGISDLVPFSHDGGSDLLDPARAKRAKAERASDAARARFGDTAILTGRGLRIQAERARRKVVEDLPSRIEIDDDEV